MLKISNLFGAAASVGLATSAALGLGIDSEDASLKAAAHTSAAVNAQIGNPDTLEFEGGLDLGADASADVADPDDFGDDFDASASADVDAAAEASLSEDDSEADANLGLGVHLGVD
jgi:hypothetical protein